MTASLIGARIERKEDYRFLTGAACIPTMSRCRARRTRRS